VKKILAFLSRHIAETVLSSAMTMACAIIPVFHQRIVSLIGENGAEVMAFMAYFIGFMAVVLIYCLILGCRCNAFIVQTCAKEETKPPQDAPKRILTPTAKGFFIDADNIAYCPRCKGRGLDMPMRRIEGKYPQWQCLACDHRSYDNPADEAREDAEKYQSLTGNPCDTASGVAL
jgi:hypothetical protein